MLAAIKMHYKTQSLLGLFLVFTIFPSCNTEPIAKNKKIKVIQEWRCDACFMGSTFVEKWFNADYKKIQYFDTNGLLRRELVTYTDQFTDINEYKYDSLKRVSSIEYYNQITKQDASPIGRARYSYSLDGNLVKITRGDEANPHTIEEYTYDSLQRKISEAYTSYQDASENRQLFIFYQYDSLDRVIRRYSLADKDHEGRFYTYPTKNTIREMSYDEDVFNYKHHTISYLNEEKQTLCDSSFEENLSTKVHRFVSTNKYSYNQSGELVKIHRYYYNSPSCLTGQKKGWYRAITEYSYEYY